MNRISFDKFGVLRQCMCMHESNKKWEFICRVDLIQNTLHSTPEHYAKLLERFASDLSDYLKGRPFDKYFIVEKKNY